MNQIRTLEKHFSIYVDGDKTMITMRDLAFWELNKINDYMEAKWKNIKVEN